MKLSNNISKKLFVWLFAALFGLLSISTSRAQIFFSNLEDTPLDNTDIRSPFLFASSFTTGSSAADVTSLTSILVNPDETVDSFMASIYSNSSGTPGSSLGEFSTVSVNPFELETTFTSTSPGINLAADTTYWLVYQAQNNLNSELTTSYSYAAGSSFSTIPGANLIYSIDGGSSWVSGGNANFIYSLSGSEVPEPSTWAMLVGGLGLLAAGYRRKFNA